MSFSTTMSRHPAPAAAAAHGSPTPNCSPLAVAHALLGFDCERRWIRHAHTDPTLRAMFPYLPAQPGYHSDSKRHVGCWPT